MIEGAYRMTDEQKLYMYLLRCAIRGEEEQEEILTQYKHVETRTILDKAVENGQHLLLTPYISAFEQLKGGEKLGIPVNLIVKQYSQYQCIRNIVTKAKEKGILLILFKGCILADLYPEYIQRISCDTDMLVYPEDRIQAEQLLAESGYVHNEEKSNPEVQVYQLEKPKHNVELHTCLWEDYSGKRLDILKEMQLDKRESLITKDVCGISVTTLGYEEHLIYQMFHIVKHFSLQGVGIKYLADITLYVDAYGQYIDYSDFWEKVERLGYDKFCYEFFNLCVELLGMKDDILQGRKAEKNSGKMLLMQDLFQMGKTYADKTAGWQIMGMMTPYFVGEKEGSHSAGKRKLQVIFPASKDLPEEYLYAKKHPVLLPIAWGHKAVRYLVRYQRNRKTWYSVSEKLDVAQKRIALMDSLGLLDKR